MIQENVQTVGGKQKAGEVLLNVHITSDNVSIRINAQIAPEPQSSNPVAHILFTTCLMLWD